MDSVSELGDVLRVLARFVAFAKDVGEIQVETRRKLVAELDGICRRCDESYSLVLARLAPVRSAFGDATTLSCALAAFSADGETREAFKPEHLCGEIDQFVQQLSSSLDPLRYSVDMSSLHALRENLKLMGRYDSQLRDCYDSQVRVMASIARELSRPEAHDDASLLRYAEWIVATFEEDLSLAVRQMRSAKARIAAAI